MFLHLGGNTVIPVKDLIAVLNIETTKQEEATQEFLQIRKKKSFIFYNSNRKRKIFYY